MKAATVVSCLAALANGAAINLARRDASPLDVKIEQVGNSELKATITNTGSSPLRVLKTGSILDDTPIERAQFSTASTDGVNRVAFNGIRVYVRDTNLPDSAFKTIGAGEKVEVQWDPAEVHDLSTGGEFNVSSVGSLRYAKEGSNDIAGQIVYDSGVLTAKVDGVKAAEVHAAFYQSLAAKRANVQNDCTGSKKTTVFKGLAEGQKLAAAAQTAAKAGTRVEQYFRSKSSGTKAAEVLGKVADYLGSSTADAKMYCSDPGVDGYIVLCENSFEVPVSGAGCRGTDLAFLMIHEATHLSEIGATDDVCYGYEGCVDTISASQSLDNADTFAMYASGIKNRC
ncbi:Neutral protease 2-like protein [Colletotrichum aenigma]|uniref:Neutral protease 2-like protein n=1 Tax=Colletotrichum aenigma TaxID=1215731 RepID=UPI0018726086|nr:Neutral protease 2-like protein [Colletotrichum aenigma]KAF5518812.1 Neutral protease 2-like protein [Colletotrichum aenigma]